MRPTGSSLGTIRVVRADKNIWFDWRVGVRGTAMKSLTLSEMLPKVDLLSVANVEASNTQIVSLEIPKKLDYRLQPGERNAVVYRFKELGEQVLAYRVDSIGADEATRRKVFTFAKAINAPTIVVPADGAALTGARQARGRICDQRRGREQGRSERSSCAPFEGPGKAHRRRRRPGRLDAGGRQAGRRSRDRQGAVAARQRRRPQRARRRWTRCAARDRCRRPWRLLPLGMARRREAAAHHGPVNRSRARRIY
jgi:hypothetical protein